MSPSPRECLVVLALALAACGPEDRVSAPDAAADRASTDSVSTCPPLCIGQLWTRRTLPRLAGTTTPTAIGVSDNGTVVGVAQKSNGHVVSFRWSAATGIVQLPVPFGLTDAQVYAVSRNGTYAAGAAVVQGSNGTLVVPLRWYLPGLTVASLLTHCSVTTGVSGVAQGVNNAGVAVGQLSGSLAGAVFWFSPTSCPVSIPLTPTTGAATGINDTGDIVSADVASGYFYRYLGPISAYHLSGGGATAINDAGTAVGNGSVNCTGDAVQWAGGGTAPVVLGAQGSCGVEISNRGRTVWAGRTGTAMTLFSGTLKSLPLRPFGINRCGDIVGYEGSNAVLYQKTICD